MPELPDIVLYLEALAPRVLHQRLERVRIASPFLVRTTDPPLEAVEGREVVALRRVGKRIVFELEEELFLVLHLMIAGRLRWRERASPKAGATLETPASIPARVGLAMFDFTTGSLLLTEAGSKRQASLHVISGARTLAGLDPGGLEVLDSTVADFGARLTSENHTLKRALTDPHIFSGIGNAYSDEILHAARMSPMKQTGTLTAHEVGTLYEATLDTLRTWIGRLRYETAGAFPEKVTAFREGMRVHGRYGNPCPDCGTPVQRIVYAANEANYCPACQTGGKLLADRALSRLLREDWPKTLADLEKRKTTRSR